MKFQTLAADPVRRLPKQNQRLANRLVVDPATRLWIRPPPCLGCSQQTLGVLAMNFCDCDQLIEDPALLLASGSRVAISDGRNKLVPRRHADLPHVRHSPASEKEQYR